MPEERRAADAGAAASRKGKRPDQGKSAREINETIAYAMW